MHNRLAFALGLALIAGSFLLVLAWPWLRTAMAPRPQVAPTPTPGIARASAPIATPTAQPTTPTAQPTGQSAPLCVASRDVNPGQGLSRAAWHPYYPEQPWEPASPGGDLRARVLQSSWQDGAGRRHDCDYVEIVTTGSGPDSQLGPFHAGGNSSADSRIRHPPVWSPDGSKLAFSIYNQGGGRTRCIVAENKAGGWEPRVLQATFGTAALDSCQYPTWISNDRLAAYAYLDGNWKLIEMDPVSGNVLFLYGTPLTAGPHVWLPDHSAFILAGLAPRSEDGVAYLFRRHEANPYEVIKLGINVSSPPTGYIDRAAPDTPGIGWDLATNPPIPIYPASHFAVQVIANSVLWLVVLAFGAFLWRLLRRATERAQKL